MFYIYIDICVSSTIANTLNIINDATPSMKISNELLCELLRSKITKMKIFIALLCYVNIYSYRKWFLLIGKEPKKHHLMTLLHPIN